MKVYARDFGVDYKDDKSPLTEADQLSNKVIIEALSKLYPQINIISEENKQLPYAERKDWHTLWLVDPLDGTKEFIKRNG
ncbi:3'(2'),5'-bisphosphate nucleotidase CysQ, partial [Klebsiella pneumoniae]|uniref:3'(2'),5'-bisphosphate nucleotidase CysQ family protein n=1 Tax=Klebsiella pneumoniae TaxID=573 RepID=UPI0038535039